MEKPFPIEQFRGLITGNAVTGPMFAESRLINSVYAAGHGMIQAKLTTEQKAHEQAAERVTEAGDQATGSESLPSRERSRKRRLAIAALRSRPAIRRPPCSRSSAVGVTASRKTGWAGAGRSIPSSREGKAWDRFCFTPFHRR